MFFLMLGICLESLNSPLKGECLIKTLRHFNQNASTFQSKRLGVFKIRRGEFLFCRSVSGHFKKVANQPSQVSRPLNLLINRPSV
jgi:hypothetical protein